MSAWFDGLFMFATVVLVINEIGKTVQAYRAIHRDRQARCEAVFRRMRQRVQWHRLGLEKKAA